MKTMATEPTSIYELKIGEFSGPLEKLLELIEAEKMV